MSRLFDNYSVYTCKEAGDRQGQGFRQCRCCPLAAGGGERPRAFGLLVCRPTYVRLWPSLPVLAAAKNASVMMGEAASAKSNDILPRMVEPGLSGNLPNYSKPTFPWHGRTPQGSLAARPHSRGLRSWRTRAQTESLKNIATQQKMLRRTKSSLN
jgi:hypothetical protein